MIDPLGYGDVYWALIMHECKFDAKATRNVIVSLESNMEIRVWNIRIFSALLEILKFSESNGSQGPYASPYLCTGPRGPGPGRQIFRGGILKKSWLKYGKRKKKAVHEREI